MTETFTLPLEDYKRLVEEAEASDILRYCSTCGAWLLIDEEAYCSADIEEDMCWKAATLDSKFDHLCRSYRAWK